MDTNVFTQLQQGIAGDVAFPGDENYARASHMLFHTPRPGAVARPKSANDVAKIVKFAKEHGLNMAIRCGGHGGIAARIPDGVLLLDMSGIASVEIIDKDKHVVRVGGGALWHQVASELGKQNLCVSAGDTRTVGVGGLTTGAGIGWVVRKYGLAIDELVGAEVVTADGQILRASNTENPDLFWAIRGGGSNFGVVTHFDFAAHELDGIYAGSIVYPLKNVAKVIKGWRDAMRQAPPELTTMLLVMPPFGPEMPASITILTCYAGTDEAEAQAALGPLRSLGEVVKDDVKRKPYADILEDAMVPPNIRVIGNDVFCKEFSDECIDTIANLSEKQPPILQIRYVARAMNPAPNGDTAFSWRDSEVLIVGPTFVAPDASEADVEKALKPWRAIEKYGQGQGVYLNLLTEDTGKELAQAFPPETLKRLEHIKAKYDPDNFFNSNYNILPKR
jgi:FAD/FMN-containing dehydrogenase